MGGARRWPRRWAVAAAVGVALLPVLPSQAATADVEVDDSRFSPGELRIDVGDEVQWTNRGDEDHSVLADDSSFDSGRVKPGETYERRFEEAGTFPYHCELHPEMTGVIRAGETTTTTAPPTTTSSTMAPTTTTSTPPAPTATTTPPTTTAPSETAPTATTTAAPATSATSAAPAAPGATSSTTAAPTTTTTGDTTATSTTTTTVGTAATTSGPVASATTTAETHAAGKATTRRNPASSEHARAVEGGHTMNGGENGEPNRLAVAAFVAVFVPLATGIAAGARRLFRGRG